MPKFREVASAKDTYKIISAYTHTHIETLSGEEAIKKYGDSDYSCGYTEGFENGGFLASVWIYPANEVFHILRRETK